MQNPSGPYPGRQLFLGLTVDRKPCFAYLVTGRSPESRERKAVTVDNTIRIGPLGNIPYDPLRHYTGIKWDNNSGVCAVSNGIQTETIFETYKLLFNVNSPVTKDYMEKILDGANAEPDSLHTPRIGGVIVNQKGNPVFILGIKTFNTPAATRQITPAPGKISGVAVYKGNMETPEPTNPANPLYELVFSGTTPHDLAKYIWDMSEASAKGSDIRVCSIGGIYTGAKWDIDTINTF